MPDDEPTARKTFEECAQFARDWHGKGGGRVMALIAPTGTWTVREPWMSRSAELASELGLGITVHVAESEMDIQFCRERYGLTPVEFLEKTGILSHRVIGAHSILLTPGDIQILSRSNYTAASCLGCYIKLCTSVTPIKDLLAAGVPVSIGTDGAQTNNNLNLWEEIHLMATLPGFLAGDAGLITKDQVLQMATRMGAHALGLENEIGTLEPGKKADLIVVDMQQPQLHPLEGVLIGALLHSASGHEVRDVWVDGHAVMRNNRILTLDEEEIMKQADSRVRRLRAEVGLPVHYSRP
jgi:5-methylthioadenosine/S-adenosylhomocysteine deaminase